MGGDNMLMESKSSEASQAQISTSEEDLYQINSEHFSLIFFKVQ
jgi:hypothetical protein